MSRYTTGEIAKLCGVTVRTVQYYDSRNILVPSELSEGGRRLYSENDLKRMQVICLLREAGIPINKIHELFIEKHPEKVISILLEQQERELLEVIDEERKKLRIVEAMQRELRDIPNFSLESIGDIAHVMKQKDTLTKMRTHLILIGLPLNALQWTSIFLWIFKGWWWMFVIWICIAIPFGIWVLGKYRRDIRYLCPECHNVFQPPLKEMLWAYHTLKLRCLTCPNCSHTGLCIEVLNEK